MPTMISNIFGSDALIVAIVALVVLFGGSQLPKLARNVSAAGQELRKAQREAEADPAGRQPSLEGPMTSAVGAQPAPLPSQPVDLQP